MDGIFIEAFRSVSDNDLLLSLESLIVVSVYKICDIRKISLRILLNDVLPQHPLYKINLDDIHYDLITEIPELAKHCIWPIFIGKTVVAGLCSVSRQIIKSSGNEEVSKLLGFREACLVACNETSMWTKFCEIDVISTVKNILCHPDKYFNSDGICIPTDILRFEYHMAQPVRMHNVYKVARQMSNNKNIKSSIPVKELNLKHEFSEGPYITLADVILFPCIQIFFKVFQCKLLEDELPLTYAWFKNMQKQKFANAEFEIHNFNFKYDFTSLFCITKADIPKQSLYAADPERYKPQNRIYTKQSDIENSLFLVNNSSINIENNHIPFGKSVDFDWDKVPREVCPFGGALPEKRAKRKCEQLENLIKPVLKLAHPGDSIIDFCSGSGHLGLLIAVLLPKCKVTLVENKERSIYRALERVEKLSLTNVTLLQCNLDYFKAKFDIGVSLHACGVATDLVIQNCIKNSAHFVCCPCCYGGIHDCYHLKYPRSKSFKNTALRYSDYLSLAHAADQTHDNNNAKTKQGYYCMDVIDTDRKLEAIENMYDVHLGKLLPVSCTPKNNLLVGICTIKV